MKKLAIALLLWCSCAPLAAPGGGGGAWQEEEPAVVPPSALQNYLEVRHAYGTGARPDFIAVMPFADESGFREGVWNVEYELGNMLSSELGVITGWQVVPFDAVAELALEFGDLSEVQALEIGRKLEADLVLMGLLQDYDMRRLSVGDPLVGGYKSYTAIAQMEVRLLHPDGGEIGIAETLRELTDRDLGLDLLGKPREQDLQFSGLKEIEFGSDSFRQTLLGRVTVEAMEELVQKVVSLSTPGDIELDDLKPEIISVYGDDIYANLGSEHGIRPRFRFAVYPSTDRIQLEGLDPRETVALVEVREIIGVRLSSLRVLNETGTIKPGDRLKLVDIEGE